MNKKKTCPICKKPESEKFKPFCSKRCMEIDLGRWLGEDYAIPAAEPPEGAEKESEKEQD